MNIFVIEDENPVRKMYERTLRQWGHTVISTKTVKDALALINSIQFDVFFIDMKLPDSSGMTVLNKISELHYTPRKVVLCSASIDEHVQNDFQARGLMTLDKPFTPMDLGNIMNVNHEC